MQSIPEYLLEAPDFRGYTCDGCQRSISLKIKASAEAKADNVEAKTDKVKVEVKTDEDEVEAEDEVDVIYHLLNSNESIDLCSGCYEKLPDLLEKRDSSYRICEICFQQIHPIEPECWGLSDYFDSCTSCLPNVKKAFYPITREVLMDTRMKLIYTDRDYMYLYVDVKADDIVIPLEVTDRIRDNFIEEYLECIVRPPSFDWNPAEWKMISDLDKMPSYSASCGFAVRCIRNCHHVASIVSDNHGRMAMNQVFDNISDFLEAEQKWQAMMKSSEDRLRIADEVDKNFKETYSCDDSLIMDATDSFAVYIRVQRNMSMYYG